MANMNYCKYRNTVDALDQIISALDYEDERIAELRKDEQRAYKELH